MQAVARSYATKWGAAYFIVYLRSLFFVQNRSLRSRSCLSLFLLIPREIPWSKYMNMSKVLLSHLQRRVNYAPGEYYYQFIPHICLCHCRVPFLVFFWGEKWEIHYMSWLVPFQVNCIVWYIGWDKKKGCSGVSSLLHEDWWSGLWISDCHVDHSIVM